MQKRHQFWLASACIVAIALWATVGASRLFAGSQTHSTATPADAKSKTLPRTVVPQVKNREVATFAAGCFWSMEAIFKQLKGVDKVTPGYAGGRVKKPSYEQVETGTTGHAEAIQVVFDPKVISYHDLLEVLFTVRNPTTRDQQGNDIGPQYRSIVFYNTPTQAKAAHQTIQEFTRARVWPGPIVTEVQPFSNFYPAESYHVDYYNLHPTQPYCSAVIAPEIAEFRAKFKSKLKS